MDAKDHRGSVVALREVRECLESPGGLLSHADGVSLAGASDQAILEEARRRNLEMSVRFEVVYEEQPIKLIPKCANGRN